MNDFKRDMAKIQHMIGDAFTATGSLVAMTDGGERSDAKLQRKLEETMEHFERAELRLRVLCETYSPGKGSYGPKPVLPVSDVTGEVEVLDGHWLHITLHTLLPHCRFQTPGWLSDTVKRLLDRYEAEGIPLPYYRNGALLAIDERSDISGRHIFDQDNKGWKAVSNALKGRIIPDDDQYSLAIALLSTRSGENACGITVLDIRDAGEFFAWRSGLDTRENGWRMD